MERMENKHFQMAKLNATMAPIVKTDIQVAKLSQHQQIYLLYGLVKKFEKIESRTKHTGHQGTYKNKDLITRNTEDISIGLLDADDIDCAQEGYFEVANKGILPNELLSFTMFTKHA
jgi:hypothetical protein